MKKQYFLIAVICLALPILLRALWFYQGFYIHGPSSQSPDFGKFQIPQPTLSTPVALETTKSDLRKTILVDLSHTNRFSLAEIDPLTNALILMGANLQIDRDGKDLYKKLQDANAYIIIAPTAAFDRDSIQMISDFVNRGGRLLLIADPTRTYQNYYFDLEDSVLIANQIIDPYDIAFDSDYVYSITHNEGNYRNIYALPAGENQLLAGISNMVFYGAHPLAGKILPLLKGDDTTLSSGTDQGGGLVIAGTSMNGNVLVIGDMGFITAPYYQVSDNSRFVNNIAAFLASTARSRSLADFPNLFTRPVTILQTNDLSYDKNTLVELATFQSTLQSRGLNLKISDQQEDSNDLLILGIYPPSEVLNNFLNSAGIQFKFPENALIASTSNAANQVIYVNNEGYFIPGLGSIPARGFNFILYSQNAKRNVLILLTESSKNIIDLIKLINKGSLKDCLMQPTIAICASGTVTRDLIVPGIITPTPAPSITITPTATPAG